MNARNYIYCVKKLLLCYTFTKKKYITHSILKPLQCVWGTFVILYTGCFFCCQLLARYRIRGVNYEQVLFGLQNWLCTCNVTL